VNQGHSGTSGTILVVEDDEQVRGFVRTLLTNAGYDVLEGRTGREGLEIARQHGNHIDLLISDMLLPELSGYDLAESLHQQFPTIKVLFMTGYVEGDIVQRSMGEIGASFLDKPFQPSVLLQRVREALPGHTNTASI
jgi:CheY-like chemotaxis protein